MSPTKVTHERKGRKQTAAPAQHPTPTHTEETAELRHGTNDNPPELVDSLKEILGQYDFGDTGYIQQSNNNTFVRMKMFDSEVIVEGETYPCKVLVQFQIPRSATEQQAA